MKNLLKDIIYKYTSIDIIDENKNLLEYPVLLEYWLYIINEMEEYDFPIISVLETMKSDEFTLKELNKRLMLIS